MPTSHVYRIAVLVLCTGTVGLSQTVAPGPLEFRAKTDYWAKETFNFKLIALPVLSGAYQMANPPDRYPRNWRQGADGYARNVGDAAISQITLFTARYAVGAALHEDPRYYPSDSTKAARRIVHALGFTLVDRGDNGNPRLAVSTLAGVTAAGFVGTSYLPSGFNDSVHAGQRCLVGLGVLAGVNLYKEFNPELKRLRQKLHLGK